MGGYKRVHEELIEIIIERAKEANWDERTIIRAMQLRGLTKEDTDYVCRIVREHRDGEDTRDS